MESDENEGLPDTSRDIPEKHISTSIRFTFSGKSHVRAEQKETISRN